MMPHSRCLPGIVPPAELEALLLERPDISDSGVIGIFSDAEATELPRAYVVPRDLTLLEDAKRGAASAFVNDVDAWVKSKVAQHKFLRGGMFVALLRFLFAMACILMFSLTTGLLRNMEICRYHTERQYPSITGREDPTEGAACHCTERSKETQSEAVNWWFAAAPTKKKHSRHRQFRGLLLLGPNHTDPLS